MEVGVQTPEETLRIKSGSCRDFAWLLIHFTPLWISSTICIWLYCTIISDVKSLDGPSGPEKILQIYMPGLKFIYQVRGGLDLIPLLAFCKRRTYSIVLYTTL
jgi:hypothetical protein